MFRLKTIVKGSNNPQLNRRVYISKADCESESTIYELIYDIHSNIDCIIYYKDEQEETLFTDEKDITHFFKSMQLVLIVATPQYVQEINTNSFLNLELSCIIKSKSLILPILYDSNILYEFANIFKLEKNTNNIQMLNHFVDGSNTPYHSKLKYFLNVKLIKSSDIIRIRNSISSFLFISYRKKDWKYIENTQRFFHDNPKLWDVGFWYDNYLVPGESWDESIKSQIKKCDAFIMLMTQNISTGNNYVVSSEYPEAVLQKKEIIPITFDDDLSGVEVSKFPQLPRIVDANKYSFYDNLTFRFCTQKNYPNKESFLEHRFLIGLAYFNGIYVEKDSSKGWMLICEAANDGYIEAAAWVKSKYFDYDDIDNGLLWHRKLLDLLHEKLHDGNVDYSLKYISERSLLLDELMKNKLYDEAKCICEENIKANGRFGNAILTISQSYYYLAIIEYNNRNYALGEEWERKYANSNIKFLEMSRISPVRVWDYYINESKIKKILGDNDGYVRNLRLAEKEILHYMSDWLDRKYEYRVVTLSVNGFGKTNYKTLKEEKEEIMLELYNVYSMLLEVSNGIENSIYIKKMENINELLKRKVSNDTNSFSIIKSEPANDSHSNNKSIQTYIDELALMKSQDGGKIQLESLNDFEEVLCVVVKEISDQYKNVAQEYARDKHNAKFHFKSLEGYVIQLDDYIFFAKDKKCYKRIYELYSLIIEIYENISKMRYRKDIKKYKDILNVIKEKNLYQ